ncbi:hypothetical protein CB1_000606042 [Camelus ferus]|nr:hypothetical protein CB1_000606042 [Camelus ferus]
MAQSVNISELNLPQLEMLKNQLDQEVEFLSTSIAQLKVVQTKYVEAKDCLNVLNKSNEGMGNRYLALSFSLIPTLQNGAEGFDYSRVPR